jgi:hypothetical protein
MEKRIRQETGAPHVGKDAVCTAGNQWVLVSTVRLSIDHGFGGSPKWYETMVFAYDTHTQEVSSWSELDCRRYETEAEAVEGHELVVTEWLAKTVIDEYEA